MIPIPPPRRSGDRLCRCGAAALLLMLCRGPVLADAPEPAAYRPEAKVEGEIRIWSSPEDAALLQKWVDGFAAVQPQAHISVTAHGPDSTMAGVYNGVADLAFMAREMRLPVEDMAFTWVYQYRPYSVEIANAGISRSRPSTTLGVFVNRANPLARMSLEQLDGIFGAEHRRGGRNLRTWGDLGLGGAWKNRPIKVYGPPVDSVQASFVRTTVLQDSYKWNADYRERPGDGAAAIEDAARDPAAIAVAPVSGAAAQDRAKLLALSASGDGPYTLPTPEAIESRIYPLARTVTMVLNRQPGKPIPAGTREFLRYLLSAEGQAAIAREGTYLPLSAGRAAEQSSRLD